MIVREKDLEKFQEFEHFGVKGMKWGVRRYRNYDGSYTQRGLKKYDASEQKYNKVKESYKSGKATKSSLKNAKRELKKNYKQLKYDKLADQGKELYKKGKRITSNETKVVATTSATALGMFAANKYFKEQKGDIKMANMSMTAIGIGGIVISSILKGKNYYENKRIRAYYSH